MPKPGSVTPSNTAWAAGGVGTPLVSINDTAASGQKSDSGRFRGGNAWILRRKGTLFLVSMDIPPPDGGIIEERVDPRDDAITAVTQAIEKMEASGSRSYVPLLPAIFALNGQPYDITRNFAVLEPLFRRDLPRRSIVMGCRQFGKSQSKAKRRVLLSWLRPYTTSLIVTPLYETVRRFSQNYVKPTILESPLRREFCRPDQEGSVLQRDFRNESKLIFTYALLDCDRARGIPADVVDYDELQDMNVDFLPVINAALNGPLSLKIEDYSGTPKTTDNTCAKVFSQSSQAEWVTKCPHGGCGHLNIPSLEYDLLAMIGPAHRNVSEKEPGTLCAKCRKPINPRFGRWWHKKPGLVDQFPGIRVPQLALPGCFANPNGWADFVGASQGARGISTAAFLNEWCGEPYDIGTKIITEAELRRSCCLPWDNKASQAVSERHRYHTRVCSVDWGGGGQEQISWTVITIVGMTYEGGTEVLWSTRVLRALDYRYEAAMIMKAYVDFECHWFTHDYNTAGAGREFLLRNSGLPLDRIIPIRYAGQSEGLVMKAATAEHPREWYSASRTWAITMVCEAIRFGVIKMFRYDYKNEDERGVVSDFLALRQQLTSRWTGADIHYIDRDPARPDDFVHTVVYGCLALWHRTGSWPQLANAGGFQLSAEHQHLVAGPSNDGYEEFIAEEFYDG